LLAVLLSFGLFVAWAAVGLAFIGLVDRRRDALQAMLLAPTVGFLACLVPTFVLSRWGVPVGQFGAVLGIALLAAAGAYYAVRRPRLPWLAWAPFAGVLVAAFYLTARPMAEFGFDWVSFCNGDMANYTLAAQRFYDAGYYERPAWPTFLEGRDYSIGYWLLFTVWNSRAGAELLLAWVMSVTGLNPHAVFMPVMAALHLSLLSGAAAMVLRARRAYWAAVTACALLAASPLTTLGTLYQLIAQVAGLAIATACVAAAAPPPTVDTAFAAGAGDAPDDGKDHRWWGQSLLLAFLALSLLIVYPELSGLTAAGLGLMAVVLVARRRVPWRWAARTYGAALGVMFVAAGPFVLGAVRFMFEQARYASGIHAWQRDVFPYYLVPTGLATLWGFMGIGDPAGLAFDPSRRIVAGAVLLLVAGGLAAWGAWRGSGPACVASVMLGLGAALFAREAAFGLYKLAMFVQPFLLAALVVGWYALLRDRRWAGVPLLALAYYASGTQGGYVYSSRGVGTAFNAIPDASGSAVNREFATAVAQHPAARVLSDTSNIVLGKFQWLYARGQPLATPGVSEIVVDGFCTTPPPGAPFLRQAMPLIEQLRARVPYQSFALHPPVPHGDGPSTNVFRWPRLGVPPPGGHPDVVVTSAPKLTVLNRRKFPAGYAGNFVAKPYADVSDHLIFLGSDLGQNGYARDRVSMHGLEGDPLFLSGTTMAGVGRHLLFRVINPSPRVRLVVNLTRSFAGDGDNALPATAAVIGDARVPLPCVGRGSMRAVSEPVPAQVIDDVPYVAIDFGTDGSVFPDHRVGLMKAFGKSVRVDARRVVGFGREVSAISEAEYAALRRPAAVSAFPSDLANPDLEYSGCYEDGWVSEHSMFGLGSPSAGPERITVRGEVPLIGDDKAYTSEVAVVVDGQEVARQGVGLGAFTVAAPVPTARAVGAARKVELRFTRYQRLPAPDDRPVAAMLKEVSLAPASATTAPSTAPIAAQTAAP